MSPCRFAFAGRSALVEVGDFRFLTDPDLLHPDAVRPLDFILLSLGDNHLDAANASFLPNDVPIIAEPRTARTLRQQGFGTTISLPIWATRTFRRGSLHVTIARLPAIRSGTRDERRRTMAMRSMIDVRCDEWSRRLLVTGEALLDTSFDDIVARLHGVDLCVVHLADDGVVALTLRNEVRDGPHALRIIRPATVPDAAALESSGGRSTIETFCDRANTAMISTTTRVLGPAESYGIWSAGRRRRLDPGGAMGLPGIGS